MNARVKSTYEGRAPEFDPALHLSGSVLKHLAIQVYSRTGYDIFDAEEDGDQPM
jgi:hypothetical protein